MRLRYERTRDTLLIRGGQGAIDYVEEMKPFLFHSPAEGRLVLLDLFRAGELLRQGGRLVGGAGDDPGGRDAEADHPGGG